MPGFLAASSERLSSASSVQAILAGLATLLLGLRQTLPAHVLGSGVGLLLAGPHSHFFRAVHSAGFALFLLVVAAHALMPKLRRFAFAEPWLTAIRQGFGG
jgi:hypothetical protein